MRIRYAAKTDVGIKRSHNEDYFSLIEDEQLFVVADGMGGHSSGEVASRMAAETVGEFYRRTKDEDATWPYKMARNLSYIENRLACGIKLANYKIFEAASQDIRYKGMGTTVVTLLISGEKLYVAHVGDSRCYRIRGDKIEQLTRDHSLLEDYRDAKPDMTAEEERNFPHKNVITRALGMRDSVQVDIATFDIEDKDILLLCSDGLSGLVNDEEVLEITNNSSDLEKLVNDLVDQANRAGGSDNITTLVLECTLADADSDHVEESNASSSDEDAADSERVTTVLDLKAHNDDGDDDDDGSDDDTQVSDTLRSTDDMRRGDDINH